MPRQVFNNTPDETAFYRLWLERETTANTLTMVQPALLSFPLGEPPAPVALDVSSIQARWHATRQAQATPCAVCRCSCSWQGSGRQLRHL